ncbi:hypothetical protein SY88_17575 [Clostridiales bacterium PH28_bin88]|nr:hypothetical protein SY88_17575 [Clostridiales bacterium PH28_bin88]
MATSAKNEGGIRSVQRAIDILNCFSWEKKELGLVEIATLIDLPKSTTSRMLQALTANGFLQRDANTGRYRLGTKLYYLGSIVKESMELRRIANPVMLNLRDETLETVNLYILEGTRRVCIEQVESPLGLRRLVRIGEQFPLWVGASGKVLMAHINRWDQEKVIREALAASSNLNPDDLLRQLEEIRHQGYYVSHGEREQGASAVAAPIFNSEGRVEAALAISGATARWTRDDVERFISMVQFAARKISGDMGWRYSRQED